MSSIKPRIGFKQIWNLIRNKKVNQINLPKGYESHKWKTSGASAISSVVNQVINQSDHKVIILIPGYFCSQSLRYLRTLPVEIIFYSLTDNLLPDFYQIQQKIKNKKIDIFLHVHYFGKVSGQEESKEFVDELGCILIEDCAHIASIDTSEWVGNFLVFSPHKHFPLPEIGLLIEKSSTTYSSIRRTKKDFFPVIWLFKEIIKLLIKPNRKYVEWNLIWTSEEESFNDLEPDDFTIRACISSLSKADKCSALSKDNAIALEKKLSHIKDWQLFTDVTYNYPYLLGLKCKNSEIAKRRMSMLNKESQLVMQWPDLPKEIYHEQEVSAQVKDWTSTVLFFFIHHKIDKVDLIEEVDRVIRKEGF